jgi:hypothetical protein
MGNKNGGRMQPDDFMTAVECRREGGGVRVIDFDRVKAIDLLKPLEAATCLVNLIQFLSSSASLRVTGIL